MKDERSKLAPAFTVPMQMKGRGIRVVPVNPTIEAALGERALATVSISASAPT